MFLKFRKKNILDRKIIKKSGIPILIKDKGWCAIFLGKGYRHIDSLGRQLGELVEKEGLIKKEIQLKKKAREEATQRILKLSDLINSKGQEDSLGELEVTKEVFEGLNEELNLLYGQLEEYPGEIERVNLQLLEETVAIAYDDLLKGTTELDNIKHKIDHYRNLINNLREQQEELEKKVDYLYSFMHAMIGPGEMEKLDIHYLKEPEEN